MTKRRASSINTALIERLNADLAAHADPRKAAPMQRYMKSSLPFNGIQTPLRRLREACRAHPCKDAESLAATMRELWLRRAAIPCQRRLGEAADAKLLYRCILPSIDSPEFFLRKGIGWALRSRAYRAPDEARAFVAEYAHRLSPLTRREALKHLAG